MRQPLAQDGLIPPPGFDIGQEYHKTMRVMVTIVMIMAPMVLIGSLLNQESQPGQAVIWALFQLCVVLMYWLYRRHRYTEVVYSFIGGMFLATIADVLTYGSIRGSGMVGFMVCVITAAMLLDRLSTLLVMGFCCVAVSLLTLAEWTGFMHRSDFAVNMEIWLSHMVSQCALGFAVYRSRYLLLRAVASQRAELERRQQAEQSLKNREILLLEAAQGVSSETGEAFFPVLVQHLSRALGADLALVGELQAPAAAEQESSLRTLALMQAGKLLPEQVYPVQGLLAQEALAQHQPWTRVSAHAMPISPAESAQWGTCRACAAVSLRDADDAVIGLLLLGWSAMREPDADVHALLMIFGGRASSELVRLRHDRQIRKLGETLEERVRDRTAQLELLNQELDAFAYSVAHDLKSPLRAIDGYTKLLSAQLGLNLGEADRILFDRVVAATARMNELIADLLELARVSRSPLQPEDVDLSELARRVVQDLQQASPKRPVQVQIETGIHLRCDGKLARIVLENLLGNAWKYTRLEPHARVELARVAPQPGQQSTWLYVRDNGVGFDMAHASGLFKPFHRLHRDTEFEGTGIGLATVYRIVQRHGGSIRCQARLGQGATFFFSFDRVQPA